LTSPDPSVSLYISARNKPQEPDVITIIELDTMDTMAVAELSNGQTLVASLLNPRFNDSGVAVFNARGKRARIGAVHPGSDMRGALQAAVKFLNG
jgi:hypothetical protein